MPKPSSSRRRLDPRWSSSLVHARCLRATALAPVVAAALVALTVAVFSSIASAKDCGGDIPCACGDRMIASTTLSADINNCQGRGLEVAAGVLDCAGRQIAGPGDRIITQEGIWLNHASGAAIRNCMLRNFGRGILVDGTTDSVIDHCEIFNNMQGIWVGDGSARNTISSTQVHDNRDEGVHLGGGSSQILVTDNEIIGNKNENLYLIDTTSNRVIDNLFDRSTEASVLLKRATNNFFAKNLLAKRNIMVRGGCTGNVFQNNQLYNGRFSFMALKDNNVWTYPSDNTVKGGRVLKAATCFMFVGAFNNTATDVLADNCRAMQEKIAGGLKPYGNSVSLNYIGGSPTPPPDGGGSGGSTDPSTPVLSKGTIKFDDPGRGRDTLQLRGTVASNTPLDALHSDVSIRFENANGVIYSVFVPAGTLRESGRSAEYDAGNNDGSLPGVRAIEIRREATKTWSFRINVQDDLSAANQAAMTLTLQIGTATYAIPETWTQTSEGWRFN